MATPGQDRIERRLAAILAADVAGYSRLTGLDEEGTHIRLRDHLRLLVDPKIAEHRGRVVKNTGDGLLAEFSSVVDAVRCALDVQRGMVQRNSDVPEEKRIEFRIGINVGDIILDHKDIFGDGVNVAVRLEGMAEPGGICVSGRVLEDVEGKIDIGFEDTGAQRLKNIARPVRVYRVRPSGTAATTRPSLPLPDKPSIAVLPFQNMSGDPEQDYFADGIVEEIITALSHFRQLFVIARNSSFTYKGRAVDVKQVGRELGVRYVLEGSVRKAGNKVRITAQLIDATTGAHLWADRFDGGLEDIFDLQDQVTGKVVGAIAPRLEQAEIERAKRKPTGSLDAYDYYLRGMAITYQMTKCANDQALKEFKKAIELDPDFAPPYARAAYLYLLRKANAWMTDSVQESAEACRLAKEAIHLGRDDAIVLSLAGLVLAYVGRDINAGAALTRRALSLNSNLAYAWGASGWISICLGEKDTAISDQATAMRLSPLDPRMFVWQTFTALAYFFAGRYDDAVLWVGRSLQDHPDYLASLRISAASNAMAGHADEAHAATIRMQQLDPSLRLSNVEQVILPLQRQQDRLRFLEALRKAGLPE
ncbi:MAG TPA: adenylate/guanylate cyclase domain-containing protein [Xanthobacteraceae bacterium]